MDARVSFRGFADPFLVHREVKIGHLGDAAELIADYSDS
jgi:hypothetical protein